MSVVMILRPLPLQIYMVCAESLCVLIVCTFDCPTTFLACQLMVTGESECGVHAYVLVCVSVSVRE